MDALLSTYASSDEESDPQPPSQPPPSKPLFSSLPKPSLISHSTPTPTPKRVVLFHPPKPLKDPVFRPDDDNDDNDDDEELENELKKRKQLNNNNINANTSVKSFLSTIPAPKNSGFGSGLGSQGTRISITAPAPSLPDTPVPDIPVPAPVPVIVDDYNGYEAMPQENYQNYDEGYYGNETVSSSSEVDRFVSMSGGGGRRRKELMPTNIVEVKQDELMKNRPTQDKAKLTGIAFGPSYQPVSAKGKPSKLHKRKHQISALYYDMKQKEPEFAERRAKGFLTKSETQAKYGW